MIWEQYAAGQLAQELSKWALSLERAQSGQAVQHKLMQANC